MKWQVVSVFDSAAKMYHPPQFVRHIGEAKRMFTQVANEKDKQIGMFPDDYVFFFLGEFDDSTGQFDQSGMKSLGFATEYVKV